MNDRPLIPASERHRPKLGVVIPVRNRPGLVLETLESVRAQTVPPHRLIVIDDGSTDETPDRVSDWLSIHGKPGWELLRATPRGAAESRQHGFSMMPDADVVAFLDSDDLWPPDLAQRAVDIFEQLPRLVGASADRRTVDASTGTDRTVSLADLPSAPLRWIMVHDAGIGSCTVIRADCLRTIGGYPTGEPTGHDIQLLARLMSQGPWAHLPGEPVTFRRHVAKARGEAGHIYQQVTDANIRHARLYHRIVSLLPPADARSRPVRRAMGKRWISAAKTAYRLGDSTGVHECLNQARRYQPISFRAARLKWKARNLRPTPSQPPPC